MLLVSPELLALLYRLANGEVSAEQLGDWLAVHLGRFLDSPRFPEKILVGELNAIHSEVEEGRKDHEYLQAWARRLLREWAGLLSPASEVTSSSKTAYQMLSISDISHVSRPRQPPSPLQLAFADI